MKDEKKSLIVVPRLAIEQRDSLIASLLTNDILFITAQTQLKEEYLNQRDELHLLLLWTVACDLNRRIGVDQLFADRVQTWNMLTAEAKMYLENGFRV